MLLIPYTKFTVETDATIHEVTRLIRLRVRPFHSNDESTADRPLEGRVGEYAFIIRRVLDMRRTWEPWLFGDVRAKGRKTCVTVTMRPDLGAIAVNAFMVLLIVLFFMMRSWTFASLFITAIVGIPLATYWVEAPKSRALLRSVITGNAVSDEAIGRHAIRDPLARLLARPVFERLRARTPYPLFGAAFYTTFFATAFIVMSPAVFGIVGDVPTALLLLAGAIAAVALGWIVLLSCLNVLGYLSGYRPYVHHWRDLSAPQAIGLSDAVARSAEAIGFNIVWRNDHAGLIAVRGLDIEATLAYPGNQFPMLLILTAHANALGRCDVKLLVRVRTSVLWDSGETHTLAEVGKQVVTNVDPSAGGLEREPTLGLAD